MNKLDIALATYSGLPALDPDEHHLLAALKARNLTAEPKVWNDPSVDWTNCRCCIVRSVWDYHKHFPDFLAWLDAVSHTVPVFNSPSLIKWNGDKRYLKELAHSGIKIVPTFWLSANERADINSLFGEIGNDLVLKPTLGLSSEGVLRVQSNGDRAAAQVHLQQLLAGGAVMVQPFIDSVETTGERALVFFDGAYSHCVSKTPFQAFAVVGEAGEQQAQAQEVDVQFAQQVLACLPEVPLYARVDLVELDRRPCLMELELVEPSLYFSFAPQAADRLAELIVHKLVK
jgi:glutathione synthase/RimK-type ligase-like ATP-grasp enzyme